MQKPLSDGELLMALAQGGKPADVALRHIYLDNRAAIGVFLRRNQGTEEEAKDVFQEAVIAFYENVQHGKFRGESAISSYLFSIARFIWLNRLKRKNIEGKTLDLFPTDDTEPELPTKLVEEESRQQLLEVFGRLGADCKNVLLKTIYYDYSMKEVAEEMCYDSEQVARNKKYLCLKKLKELIKTDPTIFQLLKPDP